MVRRYVERGALEHCYGGVRGLYGLVGGEEASVGQPAISLIGSELFLYISGEFKLFTLSISSKPRHESQTHFPKPSKTSKSLSRLESGNAAERARRVRASRPRWSRPRRGRRSSASNSWRSTPRLRPDDRFQYVRFVRRTPKLGQVSRPIRKKNTIFEYPWLFPEHLSDISSPPFTVSNHSQTPTELHMAAPFVGRRSSRNCARRECPPGEERRETDCAEDHCSKRHVADPDVMHASIVSPSGCAKTKWQKRQRKARKASSPRERQRRRALSSPGSHFGKTRLLRARVCVCARARHRAHTHTHDPFARDRG